jgi:hypothetical protein
MFAEPPTISMVQGATSTAFRSQGRAFVSNPEKWLVKRGLDTSVKLAIATFSAGWGFAHEVLSNPDSAKLIDSVLLIDGLHCPKEQLQPWVEYGKRCVEEDGPMLVMAHSMIDPPYMSARDSNTHIFDRTTNAPFSIWLDDFEDLELDKPVTIRANGQARTWTRLPLKNSLNEGGLYRLSFHGADAPTHIFMARYVQPIAWRLLAKRWGYRNTCCGESV